MKFFTKTSIPGRLSDFLCIHQERDILIFYPDAGCQGKVITGMARGETIHKMKKPFPGDLYMAFIRLDGMLSDLIVKTV